MSEAVHSTALTPQTPSLTDQLQYPSSACTSQCAGAHVINFYLPSQVCSLAATNMSASTQAHELLLQVLIDAFAAIFAPEATLLEATERE